MSNTHYYITDPTAEKGFVELTESEWYALLGTEETLPYANKVYRGEMDISEVPEELREEGHTGTSDRFAAGVTRTIRCSPELRRCI